MNLLALTPNQLRQAADIQEKIQSLQAELQQLLGSVATAASPPAEMPSTPKQRKLSAQALTNIRAGVRKRMAKNKGGTKPPAAPKRKMSPAARARLAAFAKARWAKAKKAGKSRL
jgi:hypothetical protein